MPNEISRPEFESRCTALKDDINSLGETMREDVRELKGDTRDDFKSVWKAIDGMLIRVGAVVTICSTIVMGIFKAIEVSVK